MVPSYLYGGFVEVIYKVKKKAFLKYFLFCQSSFYLTEISSRQYQGVYNVELVILS